MKQLLYGFLILMLACKNENNSNLQVSGTIKNSPVKAIYLEETSFTNSQPVIVDSAVINKTGSYALTAKPKEETIYNLRLSQNDYPFVSFINDSKKIIIDADLNNPKEVYTVKGSSASEALKEYLFTTGIKMQSIYNKTQLIDSLHANHIADSLVNLYSAEKKIAVKELKDYINDFINKSNSPALTLFALGSYQSVADNPNLKLDAFSEEEVNTIINKTAAKFPSNKMIASVKMGLQKQEQQATPVSLINKSAPDFTLPDVNGKPTSLSSFKGKYVLVDFWASWCPPCRAENPNVVKAYNEFKNKNFTILGVSLDRPGQKDAWLKAIKDDNLTWTHVSDLKFWDSEVVPLYRFEGIPYNVLVDPNGVVIAESLRGDELEQKLKEVLK